MKICVVFGGAGYIGTFLIKRFLKKKVFDTIYVGDLRIGPITDEKVKYIKLDVRKKINLDIGDNIDLSKSWVFNLAAIHREPGHMPYEYYETNILGAENVTAFTEKVGIRNLFFTSSIAVYGKSRKQKTEKSLLQPVTPYGISKAIAEKIHMIWQSKEFNTRRLIISRPSVIYGPKDPGNILRMIKAIKKGFFFFPGNPDIIKSYGYIYGLIDSIEFTMFDLNERTIVYNYAEYPPLTMREMGEHVKQFLGVSRPILSIPMPFLVSTAWGINKIFRVLKRKTSIHPVRVRKAGFPTNIKPQFLLDKNFKFAYSFDKSLEHWKSLSPHDFE